MSTDALSLPRTANRLPLLLVGLLGLIPLGIFLVNPWQPLLEHHAFRQTQTALATYWLMHDGEFFRYLTPVFGAPWTLPLEFPLFEGLVAILCKLTGLPLDFTGRLLSLVFFYGACAPIILCLRSYGWPAVIIALAFFLTAPIDLFFSRTFLIETMATMLALSALCSYILFLRTGRSGYLWAFALIGTVAGLQKVTTFLPVVAVVGLDTVRLQWNLLVRLRWREADLRAPICVALSMVLPLIWTFYSDQVKHEGTLSEFVTSAALKDWNFGTLAQRMQWSSWSQIFGSRITLLGGLVLAAPLVLLAASRKQISFNRETGLFLFSGLLGPLVFFNLHFVHDYYQVAILAFLACAVAMLIAPALQAFWETSRATFIALLLAIVAANLGVFYLHYYVPLTRVTAADGAGYDVALHLKDHEAKDEVTVIFGQDWSSVIPYYSERYAIMVPNWVPAATRADIVSDASKFAGGKRIGAIVYCEDGSRPAADVTAERDRLFAQITGKVEQVAFCDVKTRG